MVLDEVLPMGQEADHHQLQALAAALPIRLKVLDAAGSRPSVQTFEPVASTTSSSADGASNAVGSADGIAAAPAAHVLQIWLIHKPSHYDVVLPAEAFKDIEHVEDAGVYFQG